VGSPATGQAMCHGDYAPGPEDCTQRLLVSRRGDLVQCEQDERLADAGVPFGAESAEEVQLRGLFGHP